MTEQASKVSFDIPPYLSTLIGGKGATDEASMDIAILATKENLSKGGGPFGALVVDSSSGVIVGAGANLVTSQKLSVLHAEVVALMMAERNLGGFGLGNFRGTYTLYTTAEPCSMCRGALLWAGVSRIVIGASREAVESITKFDEGPPPDAKWREEFSARGISITEGVRRAECEALLELFVTGKNVHYGKTRKE